MQTPEIGRRGTSPEAKNGKLMDGGQPRKDDDELPVTKQVVFLHFHCMILRYLKECILMN